MVTFKNLAFVIPQAFRLIVGTGMLALVAGSVPAEDPTLDPSAGLRIDPEFRQRIVAQIDSNPSFGDAVVEYQWERNLFKFDGRSSQLWFRQRGRQGFTRKGSDSLVRFQVLEQASFEENARLTGGGSVQDWYFFEADFVGYRRQDAFFDHFPGDDVPFAATPLDMIEGIFISFRSPETSGMVVQRGQPEEGPRALAVRAHENGWSADSGLEETTGPDDLGYFLRTTITFVPGTALRESRAVDIVFILPDGSESEPYRWTSAVVDRWQDEFPRTITYRQFDVFGAFNSGSTIPGETSVAEAEERSLDEEWVYALTELRHPRTDDRASVTDILDRIRWIVDVRDTNEPKPRFERLPDGTQQERLVWNETGKAWIAAE